MEFFARNIKDFMVDLISALLAGFLFVFLTGFVLAFPLLLLLDKINYLDNNYDNDPMGALNKVTDGFGHSGVILVIGLLSYILGTLYTWKNPNLIDSISYHVEKEKVFKRKEREKKRNYKNSVSMPSLFSPAFMDDDELIDLNGVVEQINDPPYSSLHGIVSIFSTCIANRMPWRSGYYIKFPYVNLRAYLRERCFWQLAEKIPWDPTKPDTLRYRTKLFVDALKDNIFIASPTNYLSIARNEARVRLLSAIGYSIRIIWMLSAVMVVVISGFEGSRYLIKHNSTYNNFDGFAICVPAILWIFVCMLEKMILDVFHRIRVRELLHILLIAHILGLDAPTYQMPSTAEQKPDSGAT